MRTLRPNESLLPIRRHRHLRPRSSDQTHPPRLNKGPCTERTTRRNYRISKHSALRRKNHLTKINRPRSHLKRHAGIGIRTGRVPRLRTTSRTTPSRSRARSRKRLRPSLQRVGRTNEKRRRKHRCSNRQDTTRYTNTRLTITRRNSHRRVP